MQSCDSINDIREVSSEYIINRFTILSDLGSGIEGIVFKVVDNETNEVMALKSILLPNDAQIILGCMLMKTFPFTNSISIPKLFAVVNHNVFLDIDDPKIPNWSISQLVDTIGHRGLVFTMDILELNFMSVYGMRRNDQQTDILYELALAILALHDICVTHQDLHRENVLLRKTNEIRVYNINGRNYTVVAKHQPVIIDFGLAECIDNNESTDWTSLLELFNDVTNNKDLLDTIKIGNRNMLLSPIFDKLRERVIQPGELVRLFSPITI